MTENQLCMYLHLALLCCGPGHLALRPCCLRCVFLRLLLFVFFYLPFFPTRCATVQNSVAFSKGTACTMPPIPRRCWRYADCAAELHPGTAPASPVQLHSWPLATKGTAGLTSGGRLQETDTQEVETWWSTTEVTETS